MVAMVDAGDLGDGEPVAGPVHHLHRVAGGDVALLQDAEVGAGPAGGRELPREPLAAHADAQLEAGRTWLGDLEQGRAGPPALPDHGAADVDAADGQVVPEGPGAQLVAEFSAPPLVVL